MNEQAIAALAIESLENPDAVYVLADAIMEYGWFDERVERLICGYQPNGPESPYWNRSQFRRDCAKPGPELAKAVAAVVLFGEWPTKPFPCFSEMYEFRTFGYANLVTSGPVFNARITL